METNKILGIILVVVGALLLLGWLDIPYLGLIVGIIVVAAGIMILMGKLSGAPWMAWTLIVLGAIAVLAGLGLKIFADIANILLTLVAIVLIIVGVLKIVGKM
jgi:hypothetical protein